MTFVYVLAAIGVIAIILSVLAKLWRGVPTSGHIAKSVSAAERRTADAAHEHAIQEARRTGSPELPALEREQARREVEQHLTPPMLRYAAKHSIDLADVKGTGRGRSIRFADLQRAAEADGIDKDEGD